MWCLRTFVRHKRIGRKALALPHYRQVQRSEGSITRVPLNLPQLTIEQLRQMTETTVVTQDPPQQSESPNQDLIVTRQNKVLSNLNCEKTIKERESGDSFSSYQNHNHSVNTAVINTTQFVETVIRIIPWKRRKKEAEFLQFVCQRINENLAGFTSYEVVKLILAFSTLTRKRKQRELLFFDAETFQNLFQVLNIRDDSINAVSFLPLLRAYVRMSTSAQLSSLESLDKTKCKKSGETSSPTGATGSLAELNMIIAQCNERNSNDLEQESIHGSLNNNTDKPDIGQTQSNKVPYTNTSKIMDFDDMVYANKLRNRIGTAPLIQCISVIRAMCDKICREDTINESLSECDLVEVAQLIAAVRLRHSQLCNLISERFSLRFNSFSENDIGRLCRAFGQLRMRPEGFFELLNEELPHRIHTFHHWNLIDIAESYSVLKIAQGLPGYNLTSKSSYNKSKGVVSSTSECYKQPTKEEIDNNILAQDLVERFGKSMFKHIFSLRGSYHARALRVLVRLEVGDERTFRALVRGIPRRAYTLPTELAADTVIAASKIGMKTDTRYHILRGDRFYKMFAFHLADKFQNLRGKHIAQLVQAFGKAEHREPAFFDKITKHATVDKPHKFHLELVISMARNFVRSGHYFNRDKFLQDQTQKFNLQEQVQSNQSCSFDKYETQKALKGMRFWNENSDGLSQPELSRLGYPMLKVIRERILNGSREFTQLSEQGLISIYHLISSEEDYFGLKDPQNTQMLNKITSLLIEGRVSDISESGQRTSKTCPATDNLDGHVTYNSEPNTNLDSENQQADDQHTPISLTSLYLTPSLDEDFDSTQSFLKNTANLPPNKRFFALTVDQFWDLLDGVTLLQYCNPLLTGAVWNWVQLFSNKLDIFNLIKIMDYVCTVSPRNPFEKSNNSASKTDSLQNMGHFHLRRQLIEKTHLIHQRHIIKLLFSSYITGLHNLEPCSAESIRGDDFRTLYQRASTALDDIFVDPNDRYKAQLLQTALRLEQLEVGAGSETENKPFPAYKLAFCEYVERGKVVQSGSQMCKLSSKKMCFDTTRLGLSSISLARLVLQYSRQGLHGPSRLQFNSNIVNLSVDILIQNDIDACNQIIDASRDAEENGFASSNLGACLEEAMHRFRDNQSPLGLAIYFANRSTWRKRLPFSSTDSTLRITSDDFDSSETDFDPDSEFESSDNDLVNVYHLQDSILKKIGFKTAYIFEEDWEKLKGESQKKDYLNTIVRKHLGEHVSSESFTLNYNTSQCNS